MFINSSEDFHRFKTSWLASLSTGSGEDIEPSVIMMKKSTMVAVCDGQRSGLRMSLTSNGNQGLDSRILTQPEWMNTRCKTDACESLEVKLRIEKILKD